MGIRRDAFAYRGGDVIQMEKTRYALIQTGMSVDLNLGEKVDLKKYDLIHLFNTTRIEDTYRLFLAARRYQIPVVISTIWHSMEEMRRAYAALYHLPAFPIWIYTSCKEWLYARRAKSPSRFSAVIGYRKHVREVLSEADALLPNSHAELEILSRECDVTPRAAFVIPNGCEATTHQGLEHMKRVSILCVGRIEPRKNQLAVIESFRRVSSKMTHSRLQFYGAANLLTGYFRKFSRELSPPFIENGGPVSQTELFAAYSTARVVVLASYFETTGLTILEALAHGCSAVVSDTPYTREYFRDFVEYCDPYQTESIAAALQRAWFTKPRDCSHLLDKYSWAEAGRKTIEAYQSVLSKRAKY